MASTLKRKRLSPGGSARLRSASSAAREATFVAIVHAADGIRFTAAAETRRELIDRLADYARQRGDHALQPDHAHHLRGLLVRGDFEAAVELYFGLVGRRWDEEWLVTAVTSPNDQYAVAAVAGQVVVPEALSERPRLLDAS